MVNLSALTQEMVLVVNAVLNGAALYLLRATLKELRAIYAVQQRLIGNDDRRA